jgi:hypothetical protein
VKTISLAIVALWLAANASAEECLDKTETREGKSYSYETCVALVDDVIKANADGYVQIHYIVQYRGQRLVVEDPLSRTDYAVGEQIPFMVAKQEMHADPRVRGLYAIAIEPEPRAAECFLVMDSASRPPVVLRGEIEYAPSGSTSGAFQTVLKLTTPICVEGTARDGFHFKRESVNSLVLGIPVDLMGRLQPLDRVTLRGEFWGPAVNGGAVDNVMFAVKELL